MTPATAPLSHLESEQVRARLYQPGRPCREDPSPAEVLEAVQAGGAIAWLDLVAPGAAVLHGLADQLGLHPLAVEDALAEPQRPKLDRYREHLFIAVYLPGYDPDNCRLHPEELSVFVTDRVLITVRQRPEALDPAELTRRWDDHAKLADHGIGFLLHGLLDHIVDEQVAMTRLLEAAVEDLEDLLFDDPNGGGPEVQRQGFELRKTLTRARRLAVPTGDLLRDLDRPDNSVPGLVDEALAPYFADVRDHAVRSGDRLDGLRETVTVVLDTRLALRGDQLNEIMKKLTGWAAIIAVPTAVTGFYGQNVPYPGFQQWSGFLASLSLTTAIAVLLYVVFRRRGWL